MRDRIEILKLAGSFAENKEVAKRIRIKNIIPALTLGDEIELDFTGVSGATQSFMHALISDPIREFREIAFENLYYKNANEDIQKIISIVYRYMQESLSDNDTNHH